MLDGGPPNLFELFPRDRFPAGHSPVSVQVGDLNRDGLLDLVTANKGDNDVAVYVADGHGNFADPVAYAVGQTPADVILADLNGDQIIDIVAANSGDGMVSTLLGRGDGTFFSEQGVYNVGRQPSAVAAGDIDGDGDVDLVTANSLDNSVSVLLRLEDGTYGEPTAFPVGRLPASVALGDFNGDHHLDLATANQGSGTVSVLVGDGQGAFGSERTYAIGVEPRSLRLGDLNGDNRPDIVAAWGGPVSGGVTVLAGQADGTFVAGGTVPLSHSPSSLALGDVNSDRLLDAITSHPGGRNVSVMLGQGDGSIAGPVSYLVGVVPDPDMGGGEPLCVALGDLNGDRNLDIITAHSSGYFPIAPSRDTLSILFGNGDGTFPSPNRYGADGSGGIALAQVNDDGILDLITAGSSTIAVRFGTAEGAFTETVVSTFVPTPGSSPIRSLSVAHFNGDAFSDLIVTTPTSVLVLEGIGDGTFRDRGTIGTQMVLNGIAVGDVNGDTLADAVISADWFLPGLSLAMGNGDGTFQTPTQLFTEMSGAVYLGDLNGDGALDILSTPESNALFVLIGNGNGTFRAPAWYDPGGDLVHLAVGDLNGDNVPDVATAHRAGRTVCVLMGRGDGTLAPPVLYMLDHSPEAVYLGDLDGDGLAEIVASNASSATVLWNSGNGQFVSAGTYPLGNGPNRLALADLNGNGGADIAVASSGDGEVTVLLGRGQVTDDTWGPDQGVIVVDRMLTIVAGATLTVEPGTVVKFTSGAGLRVAGTLRVQGTASQPVVLTSIEDDSNGGDTNGDGDATIGSPGDWDGIIVRSTGRVEMDNFRLQYATTSVDANSSGAQVKLNGGVLRDGSEFGIHASSSRTEITAEN